MIVTVITYLPSPYQVELFDAIAATSGLELRVVYLEWKSSTPIAKHWETQALHHRYRVFEATEQFDHELVDQLSNSDFVVFNYYTHPWISRWMQVCEEQKVPWCFWGERSGATRWSKFGSWMRRIKLRTLKRSRAAVWGIGRLAVSGYRDEFGSSRRYVNFPYFSNLHRFQKAGENRSANRLGRVFLFSGSLIHRKGVDLLARAFSRVADTHPHVSLLLAGVGALQAELHDELARFGDRVKFLGFQDWKTLPSVYAQADIQVVPSRHDGWALVVPEALSSGLPTISTTATGAAVELIQSGKNGWLIEPNSIEALAHAMRQAAELSPELLETMRRAARESVAHLSVDAGAQQFRAAVEQSIQSYSFAFAS